MVSLKKLIQFYFQWNIFNIWYDKNQNEFDYYEIMHSRLIFHLIKYMKIWVIYKGKYIIQICFDTRLVCHLLIHCSWVIEKTCLTIHCHSPSFYWLNLYTVYLYQGALNIYRHERRTQGPTFLLLVQIDHRLAWHGQEVDWC